jgi:hypothetical protein
VGCPSRRAAAATDRREHLKRRRGCCWRPGAVAAAVKSSVSESAYPVRSAGPWPSWKRLQVRT